MATRWSETDMEILGHLMTKASRMKESLDDLDSLDALLSADEREDVDDAQYHARKLYRLLSRLAVKAERERKEALAEEAEPQP